MNFKGKYPHEIYEVFDNTEYMSLPASVTGSRAVIAYLSDKGQDGVIKLYDNLGTFLKENGNPNFRRHGQSIYNAIAHLTAGGQVYGYRIAATDATYANLLVKVGYKVEQVQADPDGDGPLEEGNINKATIKVTVENVANLKSMDEVEKKLTAAAADEGGFTTQPLFMVKAKGRGSAANGSVIRLSRNAQMVQDHNKPIYNMEVMYFDNGVGTYETGGAFTTYLDPEYKINAISYYLENMSKKYLEMHDILVNEEAVYALEEALKPVAETAGLPSAKVLDYLLKPAKELPYLVFAPESVDLSAAAGFTVKGGVDGTWTGKLDWEKWKGLKEAFTQFYSGVSAPELLDINQIPASVMYDANYPVDVKNAMATLVLDESKRHDIMCYLDLGIVKNATAAKEVMDSLTVDNCQVAVQGWFHNYYDPYTEKDIPVTGTWTTAAMLPSHDNNFGLHRPMAGFNCGQVSGVVADTLFPLPVGDEKAKLYDSKINYIEKIKGQYLIASQITTQKKQSDLELINNNRLKGQIIRKIMALVPQFKHNFSDPATLKQFKDLAILQLEEESRLCNQPITITFSQTQYQKDNRILQVELRCVFKSVIERIYVPIYIDKNIGTVEV